MDFPRFLIVLGLAIVAFDCSGPLPAKSSLGRLSGDIVIERENFTLHVPPMSRVLVSLMLSALLWLVAR